MRRGMSGLIVAMLILLGGIGGGIARAAPRFEDVPPSYWAYVQIEEFSDRGITTGCDVGRYCPERGVTRAEMAVFLDRALGYPDPATPAKPRFTDVPASYWAYAFIDRFATLGITTGCDGTEFCPNRGVTRAEMAAFLIRALAQTGVAPPAPTFADVPASHPQYGYIEALVRLGVTTGCGANDANQRVYCPDRGVTRAEMAVFITRAFPLAASSPAPAPPPVPSRSPAPSVSPSPSASPAPTFDPYRYVGQGDAYNCTDFASQARAQAVLRADPRDPNKLDANADGLACESNPPPYDFNRVPRR